MTSYDAANIAAYTEHVHEYRTTELWPAERLLLERFRDRWPTARVLDLGVGTGRTAWTFSALGQEYVGVDYVPAMIKACRRRIPESARVRFTVGDARSMPEFEDETFDFVLFCWNGIDCIDPPGRARALDEIRRVLRPDGRFFFSSHTQDDLPFRVRPPRLEWHRPAHAVVRVLRYLRDRARMWRRYRGVDWAALKRRPVCTATPPDHDFGLSAVYTDPDHQLRQLQARGFTIEDIWMPSGTRVTDAPGSVHAGYLYYLCSKSGS